MNIRVHTPTTTQRDVLARELRSASGDGVIDLAESMRLVDAVGPVPSKYGADVLTRAQKKVDLDGDGYEAREVMRTSLSNFAAGSAVAQAIRDVVGDGKVTMREVHGLLLDADTTKPAVRAHLAALLRTDDLTWRADAKAAVVDELADHVVSKTRPLDVFYAVLESKKIAFDDSMGEPRLPVKAAEVKDKHLRGELRTALQETRRTMGEPSEANQIRGPWAIDHEGQRYFAFFHDESQHGRAVLADASGRVVLDQFVLING